MDAHSINNNRVRSIGLDVTQTDTHSIINKARARNFVIKTHWAAADARHKYTHTHIGLSKVII